MRAYVGLDPTIGISFITFDQLITISLTHLNQFLFISKYIQDLNSVLEMVWLIFRIS